MQQQVSIWCAQLISCLLAAAANAQDEYFRQPEKIVKASNEVGERLGNYAFTYETEGGILQSEVGQRKHQGTEDEAQLIQGSVQYNAPDGTPVALSWTADEFGTQVRGTHLPTPPPIPPAIARALEWLAKQPSTTEQPEVEQKPYKAQEDTFAKPIVVKKQTFTKPLGLNKSQRF
ncbi:unnamed protein product [Trichogramma brassicae]|uniref:Endocuticle structural glycoprotein SgAbd-2 n=1 Tax=Trichogramma brassicae TaxID=86971 RepID=A0A6H5HZ95_9HYME|nr:unnamed protein product [Trichogramma brassicae]